jgi:type II secretory pathway predicted ATPase ExeA
MSSRFRKPEEQRLELSGGDWLLVRKHLTAGEERAAHAHLMKAGTFRAGGERPEIDYEQLGIAQAVSYLLDWSLTDADDKPIGIRDQSYEFIAAALRGMTPESLAEILAAVQAHDAAMTAAREGEKKRPVGATASPPISASVE